MTWVGRRAIKDMEPYKHASFPPLPMPPGHTTLTGCREERRGETYKAAALDLLFLYRLDKDKKDAPFPRDKGSSGKLKRRDNMLEIQYLSPKFSTFKRDF